MGIAISSGLNMINDSFRVTLNEKSAKLFRSGSFTVMNLLMMNGYGFQDMLGRSGASVSVRINGKRKVFYGMAAQPASLFINKKEGRLSDIVRAGDHIEFVPAVQGLSAKPCVRDVEGAAECLELTLNGQPADLETPLKNGDIILMMLSDEQLAARKREEEKKAAEEAADQNTDFYFLARLYEEISSTFNKIYVCAKTSNYILAFLSAVCLQNELKEIAGEQGILCYDILGAYSYRNLEKLAETTRRAEQDFVP